MIIYTDLVNRVIADITRKVPELSHIDPDRVAVAAAPRWAGTRHGELAKCVTLHHDRAPSFYVWIRPGTRSIMAVSPWYRTQPAEINMNGVKCKYLVRLTMPRFFNDNPVETIIHELYHIGDKFDGSLRDARHGKAYDRQVFILMGQWLARANTKLAEMAQLRLPDLQRRYGSILARSLPTHYQESLTKPSPAPFSYEKGVQLYYPGYTLAKNYSIREIVFTPDSIPSRITDKDCTLRLFKTGRSQTIARTYERYMRLDHLPLEQFGSLSQERVFSAA